MDLTHTIDKGFKQHIEMDEYFEFKERKAREDQKERDRIDFKLQQQEKRAIKAEQTSSTIVRFLGVTLACIVLATLFYLLGMLSPL